jgi:arsenate reductase
LRISVSFEKTAASLTDCSVGHQPGRKQVPKRKVLFICVHNSARSQMAAALVNKLCSEFFEAESAGLEPGQLNPLVIQVLMEVGVDISKNKTQRVFDVWKSSRIFQYVITVCSQAKAEGCPIFPGITTRLHWPFPDPSKFSGTDAEKIEQTRRVMDQISAKIDSFCEEHCAATSAL